MKDLREDSDLKQKDMAEILGLTNQQAYQRYESGKVLIPLPLLIKIADHFKVSLDYLCGLTNNPTKFW
ncbi:MAG: helix-turn-helix transcriptional regulator [Oscillospiraceae bacterium]|nr:helix-turn-helix transcriptional regulator [Oscillospiraceae bacterium]